MPYALSLRPGAKIQQDSVSAELVTSKLGEGFRPLYIPSELKERALGVSTVTAPMPSEFTGNQSVRRALASTALAGATSGTTYGVHGQAQSPDGYGGYFENRATSGVAYALYAKSDGNTGISWGGLNVGVLRLCLCFLWPTYGVRGTTYSPQGMGVYGLALQTTWYVLRHIRRRSLARWLWGVFCEYFHWRGPVRTHE